MSRLKIFGNRNTFDTFIWGLIQKFPDWPPGARTANGRAHCH